MPLFPLHTWLPDAHTEAPTAGSVILAGIMLKLGTYGFLRFGVYLFPEAAVYFAPTFAHAGGDRHRLRRHRRHDADAISSVSWPIRRSPTSVSSSSEPSRSTAEGLEGGILQMVNHGISTGALFFLVGMIYERRHTREISELKGLQKSAPIMAGVFTVVMFSSIGLPGLNGFVGEFLTLLGTFAAHRWWAVVAAIGVILAALYLLWAYQRVFHGTPDEANRVDARSRGREALVLAR